MRRFLTILLIWLMPALAAFSVGSFSERLTSLQTQLAADPTNITVLLKLGDLCHDEGVNDNREAVKLAEKYLLQLLAIDNTNAMGRVLYGSTLTMKGRDAFWPTTRLSHVKEGIRQMDAAVKLAPEDPRVRFTRANNNFFMPNWLGRGEIVQADFAWLWDQVQTKPAGIEIDIQQNVALRQGQLLKKRNQISEALKIWRKGIELAPQSSIAKEIQAELDKTSAKEKK